ncbi:hypothetical protein GGQ99_001586 [Aminobacter niigataensis]|uniref:Uncharacterized protein n=1 Tax=Aminobacter niigataensis TaxID=83265 RepID=A0ABR6KZC0_9HYPH|nr:hypothetical protein [Aminobacter niigataensis]MBB4649864.1 hypothetical protein [Aminobacter niigataensis]
MARTPAGQTSGHQPDQLPSLGNDATGRPVSISLTATAKAYVGKAGIDVELEAMRLSADCQIGDVVSISSGGTSHDFAVMRRRWIVDRSRSRLEVTLDHPVRGR